MSKVRCDCVDRNGNVWPDCTCNNGWRDAPAPNRDADLTRLRTAADAMAEALRKISVLWPAGSSGIVDERSQRLVYGKDYLRCTHCGERGHQAWDTNGHFYPALRHAANCRQRTGEIVRDALAAWERACGREVRP